MKNKFHSQICTTREQSERLLALGLKKENADMNYTRLSRGDSWTLFIGKPLGYEDIPTEYLLPAWSLHRLMEIYNLRNMELEEGEISNIYDLVIKAISISLTLGNYNKEYFTDEDLH